MNRPPLPSAQALRSELDRRGIVLPAGPVRVGAFGDSAELSAELLALIREGPKRGGASLAWAHEFDADPLPVVGEIEIVVDHLNAPALVTRTVAVDIVPFNQVDAAWAVREGEGDGSLAFWREAHWTYFGRECERIGREPSETMLVVCSAFEVLHVVPAADDGTPSQG